MNFNFDMMLHLAVKMVGTDLSVYCILCKVQSRVICWCRHLVDCKGQRFKVRSHCAEDLFYPCLFQSKSHFPLTFVLSGKSTHFYATFVWSDCTVENHRPAILFPICQAGASWKRCRDRQTFCAPGQRIDWFDSWGRCKNLPLGPEVEYDTVTSD